MIEQKKKVVWTIDEIERALQSDTLNETGIHDIKLFYQVDKTVLWIPLLIKFNHQIQDNQKYDGYKVKQILGKIIEEVKSKESE